MFKAMSHARVRESAVARCGMAIDLSGQTVGGAAAEEALYEAALRGSLDAWEGTASRGTLVDAVLDFLQRHIDSAEQLVQETAFFREARTARGALTRRNSEPRARTRCAGRARRARAARVVAADGARWARAHRDPAARRPAARPHHPPRGVPGDSGVAALARALARGA